MSYLARGPVGTTGIDSKAHASKEPTPFRVQTARATGGDGMSYLARGPVGTTGIDSKAHASKEPPPFRAQFVDVAGGDGMSQFANPAIAVPRSSTLAQATP